MAQNNSLNQRSQHFVTGNPAALNVTDSNNNALLSAGQSFFRLGTGAYIGFSNLQFGVFTAGQTITGSPSGATGLIVSVTGNILMITNITGTFTTSDTITNGTATADVDGVANDTGDTRDGVLMVRDGNYNTMQIRDYSGTPRVIIRGQAESGGNISSYMDETNVTLFNGFGQGETNSYGSFNTAGISGVPFYIEGKGMDITFRTANISNASPSGSFVERMKILRGGGISILPQYSTAGSGTVTSNGSPQLILNASGTVASLTVTFPPPPTLPTPVGTEFPANGQIFTISSTQIITSLTLQAFDSSSTPIPITGTLTALTADGFASWVYSLTANSWIRKG